MTIFYDVTRRLLDDRLSIVKNGVTPSFTDLRHLFYECRNKFLRENTQFTEIDGKDKNKYAGYLKIITEWCVQHCSDFGFDKSLWWRVREKLNIWAKGKATCGGEVEKFFFQGCGNRFLYVKNKLPVQNRDTVDTLFNKAPKWNLDGIPAELEPFYSFLETISEEPYTILMGDQNTLEMSVKFHNDRETAKDNIKESDENAFKREYITRDWQKSLKLAQLHAISRKGCSESSLKVQADGKRLIEMEVQDIEWGQKIVVDCFNHFEQIVTEWKANTPTESKKVITDVGLANKYLGVIKDYGTISQMKLAKEVGNIQRDTVFYNVLGYLIGSGCVDQVKDCGDFIRQQGTQWMKEQKISPNFKTSPTLYKYVQSLE